MVNSTGKDIPIDERILDKKQAKASRFLKQHFSFKSFPVFQLKTAVLIHYSWFIYAFPMLYPYFISEG